MESKKKRLFFAIWPDEATRRRIGAASERLLNAHAGWPVARQNLHMTVAFLNFVDAGRVAGIVAAAAECRGEAFQMTLDNVGYWRRSRVLWFGCSQTPAPLTRLVEGLWERLAGLGFEPEQRAFQPHVTLARRASPPRRTAQTVSIAWPVEAFCLVESVPGGRGSRYEVVSEWPLIAGDRLRAGPARS